MLLLLCSVFKAVVPDDEPLTGSKRHWSAASGGCEGIDNAEATTVEPTTIHRNNELYQMYQNLFPFISTGDDTERLKAKTDVIRVRMLLLNPELCTSLMTP